MYIYFNEKEINKIIDNIEECCSEYCGLCNSHYKYENCDERRILDKLYICKNEYKLKEQKEIK